MALRNVKVLDFSRVLAGPFCTMLLGDLGAQVLKIEQPPRHLANAHKKNGLATEWIKRAWADKHRYHKHTSGGGDDSRRFGPPFLPHGIASKSEDDRLSTYYLAVNRNKLSVALDLKNTKGKEIAKNLAVNWADVCVENFKPGTMEKLGLSYEDVLQKENERLIYCSITGYGPDGPWAKLPGYDVVISGTHGLMSITGHDDVPAKVGVAMTDLVTGSFAQGAILAALYARDSDVNGRGQRVDCSLMESQLACLSSVAAAALNALPGTPPPARRGTAHPNIAPYQAFKCKDGGHIVVGAGNDKQFRLLCETLNVSHLADDPRFISNDARVVAQKTLIPLLEEAFAKKTRDEWSGLLQGHGFAVGPVRSVPESFSCEQALHRNMSLTFEHPVAGSVTVPGHPVKYSISPIADGGAASASGKGGGSLPLLYPPMLGEHTEDVLINTLGISQDEIYELEDEGVIHCYRKDEYDHEFA